MIRALSLPTVLLLATVTALAAQTRSGSFGLPDDQWCRQERQANFCEVRQDTLLGLSSVEVDATPNGGIAVRGWDRGDVQLRTKISVFAESDADARDVAAGVTVETGGGSIRAAGPEVRGRNYWTASFELQVPRTSSLALKARNGGIAIGEFAGAARFESTNGGVALTRVDGDVRGETVNGGIAIELAGSRWTGAGLDVETRNGGITMAIPRNYSAQLEVGTTNGGFAIDFPLNVQGNLTRFDRHILTTLGAGGPRVRAMTVNGGIAIRAR